MQAVIIVIVCHLRRLWSSGRAVRPQSSTVPYKSCYQMAFIQAVVIYVQGCRLQRLWSSGRVCRHQSRAASLKLRNRMPRNVTGYCRLRDEMALT